MAIREHKDATAEEKAARLCNAGPIAFRGVEALLMLEAVRPDNAQKEYYLTDLVEIANARGLLARTIEADEAEVMGVNDRVSSQPPRRRCRRALRRAVMLEGATLIAPETVFLSFDAKIGRDVLIEPHVIIEPGVTIEDGTVVHAFSHLEGARVGAGATVGPYTRLGPARHCGEGEGRQFRRDQEGAIEAGAEVNHLSYIGDARVGAKANIGAGTITCNYDGFLKPGPTSARAPSSVQFLPCRARPDRRRRLRRLGFGYHQGRSSRCTRRRPRPAGPGAGWAKAFRTRRKKD